MTFKITRASELDYIVYMTFRTLEELRDFVISQNEKQSHALFIGIIWNC